MNNSNKNRNLGFKFLYSGSFDPITRGHLSLPLSVLNKDPDAKVVILIVENPDKKSTFTFEERKFMIENSIEAKYKDRICVEIYHGLVPDYVYDNDVAYIIKGVRDEKDSSWEQDFEILCGEHFGAPITLMVPQTEPLLSSVSATNLKILSNIVGISLNKYATAFVREALKIKKTGKLIIGVTGGIASGKSTLCSELSKFSEDKSVKVIHLNMDIVSHTILDEKDNCIPLFHRIRKELINEFGECIQKEDGTIDRKILGEIVFGNEKKLDILTNIMVKPSLHLMSKKVQSLKSGIILIESAILIDRNLTEIVDENIINVIVSPETQRQRMLKNRKFTFVQADRRVKSQLTSEELQLRIKEKQSLEFDRLYMGISADMQFDIPQIYESLKMEYLRRKEIIRFGNLIIPSQVSFEDEKIFVEIVLEKYSEKHRRYHNLKHIEEMLMHMQELNHVFSNPFENPIEIYLAIIFHDIIYDVESKENEANSAVFASEFLSKNLINKEVNLKILNRFIHLTALYGKDSLMREILTEDEKRFLDMDTAIFAADKKRLQEYEDGVFYEFSTLYTKEEYLKGRIQFLEKLIKRNVFHSEIFRNKYEQKAKENIKLILDGLRKSRA